MKKVMLLLSLGLVGSVHAISSTTVWSNTVAIYDWLGALVPGNSTWAVRMYESVDSTINFNNLLPSGEMIPIPVTNLFSVYPAWPMDSAKQPSTTPSISATETKPTL
jgi:hypothetical protein